MPRKPVAELCRRIIEHALQLRTAFEAAPDEARGAMRALLGERRMKVMEDPQHGWRVERKLPLSVDSGKLRLSRGKRERNGGSRGSWNRRSRRS